MIPDFAAIVREAEPEELPALLGKLAEAEAVVRVRLMTTTRPADGRGLGPEENLSADEAARRLGVSRDFLYKAKLPFKLKIGSRVLFSANGLAEWNRKRMGRS